jgi:hypothetical protein
LSNDAKKDEIAQRYGKALAEETDLPEHEQRLVDLFREALSDYGALRETNGQRCGMCGGTGIAVPISEEEEREANDAMENVRRTIERIAKEAFDPHRSQKAGQ